jgi:hypothetical protein
LVPLVWTGPDTLTAEIPLEGEETALSTVSVPGQKPQALAPVCLPYSPEFAPAPTGTPDGDRGRATLERLARATGGVERVELSGVWRELPRRPRAFHLAPWLLTAAVILLLLEVLERRTGLVSRGGQLSLGVVDRAARVARKVRPAPTVVKAAPAAPAAAPRPTTPTAPVVAVPPPKPVPAQPESKGGVLDAMRQARERTRGRTE